jgi:hypothetical protein
MIIMSLALKDHNEYVPNLRDYIGKELIVTGFAGAGMIKEEKKKKKKKSGNAGSLIKRKKKPKYLYPLDAKTL